MNELYEFAGWVNKQAQEGTDVTIKAWPDLGTPRIEIYAGGTCVATGEEFLEAILNGQLKAKSPSPSSPDPAA